MMKIIIAVLAGLIPMVPAVIFFIRQRKKKLEKATNGLLLGLKGFNIIVGLMAAGFGLIWLASPATVMAASPSATAPAWIPMLRWQPHWPRGSPPSALASLLAAPARRPSVR